MPTEILILDDDADVRETITSLVTRLGYEALGAGTIAEAREVLKESSIDLVFLDLRLPDGNGLDLLHEINKKPGSPEVVILTGLGDPDGAELAIQGGAWDYLVKPASVKDISLTLKRALKYREEKKGKSETVALHLDNVVGVSPAIRRLYDQIAIASTSHANVLVTGETGTGKELIARTVHENSPRQSQNFVVVDCASLTENLIESTLFGHRRGAFTGATADQPGLVKLADKGTLFLDEIGEMPLTLQKSFLRVLQERSFRPVGEVREVKSDFRLISATNRDLHEMVRKGQFREDLWFRIKTIHLHLPPLRERLEDIKPLTKHHIDTLCDRYGTPLKGIDSDFFGALTDYEWPGNVRELFNVLERAFVAAAGEPTLYAQHLPEELRISVAKAQIERKKPSARLEPAEPEGWLQEPDGEKQGELPPLKEFKSQAERRYLQSIIDRTGGDLGEMIKMSGLSRSHFYALVKKYGLSL
jgi:two-component system NtrC family response regulator